MLKEHIHKLNRRHFVSLLLLGLVVYVAIVTLGVIGRNFTLQQRVDELNQEIETIRLEKQELEYRITYYQTDAFVEREAREKLGLRAPGEHVIIFPDKVPRGSEILEQERALAERSWVEVARDNWDQWLYFLFRIEP